MVLSSEEGDSDAEDAVSSSSTSLVQPSVAGSFWRTLIEEESESQSVVLDTQHQLPSLVRKTDNFVSVISESY